MTTRRTTASLIRNAIEAAQSAGFQIGAVEVLPGGAVRILPINAISAHPAPISEGNTCDDLFREASD